MAGYLDRRRLLPVLCRFGRPGIPWSPQRPPVLAPLWASRRPLRRRGALRSAPAFVLGIYVTMVAVARLGARAAPIVVALVAAAIFVPIAVPSWHQHLGSAISNFTPIAIPVVAVVTFVVVRSVRDALALAEARAELACLAAETERSRIARDLHDLLGHSLTTITVKAGLARRLGARSSASRPGDRRGRDSHPPGPRRGAGRRGGLPGCHPRRGAARGRELLRASGVTADLPTASDVVDPAHQELFGWAVREGLTNVVRHAHATRCTVTLAASEVDIRRRRRGRAGPIRQRPDRPARTGRRRPEARWMPDPSTRRLAAPGRRQRERLLRRHDHTPAPRRRPGTGTYRPGHAAGPRGGLRGRRLGWPRRPGRRRRSKPDSPTWPSSTSRCPVSTAWPPLR